MNIGIIKKRNKIIELKKERDEMFSILDEVDYNNQTILLEAIIDLTNEIDRLKKEMELLLNENI